VSSSLEETVQLAASLRDGSSHRLRKLPAEFGLLLVDSIEETLDNGEAFVKRLPVAPVLLGGLASLYNSIETI
jgi:hypothetical protein